MLDILCSYKYSGALLWDTGYWQTVRSFQVLLLRFFGQNGSSALARAACCHHWGKNASLYSTGVPWSLRFFGIAGENRALAPLTLGVVISWPWVVSSRAHPEHCSLNPQGEPFAGLWATFSSAFHPPNSGCLGSASATQLWSLSWGLETVPCAEDWKLSQGTEGVYYQLHLIRFPSLRESLFFVTWHLVSWEPLFYTFCVLSPLSCLIRGNSHNIS